MYVRRNGESKFISRYKCCTTTDAAAHIRDTLRGVGEDQERLISKKACHVPKGVMIQHTKVEQQLLHPHHKIKNSPRA